MGASRSSTPLRGHSSAAVAAEAESLTPGFGAPATEGIVPVIRPVSANGLPGMPAPGLPTKLPDALTLSR
ncbi:hypothetical protein BDD21_4722 [Thiocapsa rosea]|uniref:Uncharacterized protein n=1 Tax=Thiocapsa rosea TaxID=69360 RepID=A0A495VEZ1_9GAMM|nr:hypothetical protein BDD21_4722 [Thiocapsa rosea]